MKRFLTLLLMGSLIVACNKEDDQDQTNNDPTPPSEPANHTPAEAKNADGVLIALQSSTTINVPGVGSVSSVVGLPFAKFGDGLDAGTVTCEGTELAKQSGNYIFTPGMTNPTGVDFDSEINWSISGSGDVPAFDYDFSKAVPAIGALTGATDDEVDLSAEFILGIDMQDPAVNLAPADSILFGIYDFEGNFVFKTVAKSQTSVSFTPAEMEDLVTGGGYIQANAYTYTLQTINGLELAFINQGNATATVDLK